MALTSFQKNYIRKNYKNLSIEEMALDLGVNTRNIRKFCTKKELRIKEVINNGTDKTEKTNKIFDFNVFVAENIWIFMGLFLLVLLTYFNAVNNAFVSDDVAAILKNPAVGDWKNIFSGIIKFSPQSFFIFIAFHLGGLNPAYFRIVNMALHLSSVFSIFTLISLISKKKIAVFAAIIFAAHPLLTESVTWISGMPYALSGLFVLLSFIFYILAEKKKTKLVISLVFFLLALASSEKVAPFPAMLFLYELVFSDWKMNWKKLAPYFSLAFVWTIILFGKIGMRQEVLQTQHYQEGGTENPFIQVPIAIVNYLKLILWPSNLTLYHTDLTVTMNGYYFILAIFLVFVGIIIYSYKKNKQVFFWLAFFVISLLTTLTPLKISWVVAERYVYLGSIGIFVVVAMGFDWLLSQKEKLKKYACPVTYGITNSRVLAKNNFFITAGGFLYKYLSAGVYVVFAMIIFALSVRTILRNMDWKNEDTLWVASAKVSEAGPVIHNNLGDMYVRQGNFEKATEEFKKAIEINPRYADAYHNLALTYLQMQKIDLAIESFQKAILLNANLWQSYQQLAGIYYNQGKYDLALENIKKALEISPNDPQLQDNRKTIEDKIASF